jgi:integrase
MSSITKDTHSPPKSPFWIACFNGIGTDGRIQRFKRSTKTTDAKLARRLADEWEQLAKQEGEKRLTESQCRKVISSMYERIIGKPLHFRTARAYLAEWLENSKTDTTASTYGRYQRIVGRFLTHIGIKADRLLREVTAKDILSWRDALKAKGLSPTTINGNIQILRMPFKAAHDNGLIDLNPLTKTSVKLFKDEARNVVKDVFSPEQIAALLLASPSDDWRGAILCGYYTGLRLRDVTELRWNAVDIAEGTITVTTRKTRKDVILPIHPELSQWLRKQTRGIGRAPLFVSLYGKTGSGRGGLSSQFRRIMERANIHGRPLREATGAGRPHSSLSYHSLRHSFNSSLQAAGVGVEVRQELVGHSSAAMNAIYSHADLGLKRAAIAALPEIPKARGR